MRKYHALLPTLKFRNQIHALLKNYLFLNISNFINIQLLVWNSLLYLLSIKNPTQLKIYID